MELYATTYALSGLKTTKVCLQSPNNESHECRKVIKFMKVIIFVRFIEIIKTTKVIKSHNFFYRSKIEGNKFSESINGIWATKLVSKRWPHWNFITCCYIQKGLINKQCLTSWTNVRSTIQWRSGWIKWSGPERNIVFGKFGHFTVNSKHLESSHTNK
jgi:hypothetical protein